MMMAALVAALAMTASATMFKWTAWFGELDGSNGEDWLYGTDGAPSSMSVSLLVYCFGPGGPAPIFDADSFDLMAGTLTSASGVLGDAVQINQVLNGAFTECEWEEPGRSWWAGGDVDQASWYAVVVMTDGGLFGIDVFEGDFFMNRDESGQYPISYNESIKAGNFAWGGDPGLDFIRHISFLDPDAMAALELEYGRYKLTYIANGGDLPSSLREEYIYSPGGFFGVIPEPATGLLALAGIALLVRRKRK